MGNILEDLRLINIEILVSVWEYVRGHNGIDERKEKNYITKIARETGWSYPSVVKTVDILERMDLVIRVDNGRKNVIKAKL